MIAFATRRLIAAIPLLLLVTLLSFALMGLAPGGPAAVLGAQARGMTPAARAHFEHLLGLDRPWYVQYAFWLGSLLHGSLGTSYVDGRPVAAKILEKLPITLELLVPVLVVTLLVAIPIGVVSALRRGSLFDDVATVVAFLAYGTPVFVLGVVLVDVFAVHLRWFPASGIASVGREHDPLDRAWHLVLPVVSLVVVSFAGWMRYQRAAMIEVLDAPYVRTARAKGLAESAVVVRHALRNALLPIVTLVGLSLPGLIGGAYFVEFVFSLPGMGYLGVTSVFARDYPTVMGITLFSAVLVIAGNLAADLAYAVVDPRIRYD